MKKQVKTTLCLVISLLMLLPVLAFGAAAEDPKNFGKAIIFVALGEGIALYGMLISILILNG